MQIRVVRQQLVALVRFPPSREDDGLLAVHGNRQSMAIHRLRHFVSIIMLIGGACSTADALQPVHLLGFVERLCAHEPHCFELRVEKEYVGVVGRRITVRFKQVTAIFDPENYELTLEQSNIIPGSHLRLLLADDPGTAENNYRAEYIWIGD